MKVKDLIKKLKGMDQEAKVWMQDAGDPHFGSDLTGYMGSDCAEAEEVREIDEGIMITRY